MENTSDLTPSSICIERIQKGEPAFVILRASAGSGKTFNLVRVFLALCLRGRTPGYFRHILAITFTNKAANEMKERVLKGVREVSRGEGDHIEYLSIELGLSKDELRDRAVAVHDEMMTNYGLLSIMTIDKFVNRIVRSFTRELSLDSEFKIMLDQNALIRDGVDALLARVGGVDPALTRVIERYALQRVDDEKAWDMRTDLNEFGKLLFNEQVAPALSELDGMTADDFLALHDRLQKEIKEVNNRIAKHADEALQCIDDAGVEHNAFSGKGGLLPAYLKKLKAGSIDVPNATVHSISTGIKKPYPAKIDQETASRIDEIMPEVMEHLRQIMNELYDERGRERLSRIALVGSMFQLAALNELRQAVSGVREARNVMTFNDLNRLIELLVSGNPAPFIYERLGERYRHFLIDEFQDTSVVQWQNFLPLIEESLGRGHYNLIVGDGKQAIYRWRNGDVRQLQKMPEIVGRQLTPEMKQREAALKRNAHHGNLAENWRSLNGVVEFNNRFFSEAKEVLDESLQSIYDAPGQVPKGGEGGWVTAEGYYHRSSEEMHTERMDRLLRLINENLALNYRRSDIAILVRDNKVGGRIARSLLEKGIETVTAESLQLGQHPAAWAVVSLLRWVNDRNDMTAAAWFLQCYHAIVHGDAAQTEHDLLNFMSKQPQYEGKSERLRFDIEKFLRTTFAINSPEELSGRPLYEVVDLVIKLLEIGTRHPAHAEALLKLAFAYQSEENEGIQGFIAHWDAEGHRKSIAVPGEVDGVRIMTVHKSKGLEFPVVINLISGGSPSADQRLHPVHLPDERFGIPVAVVPLSRLESTVAHSDYLEEKHRQLLDDLNVVYVGMTRAARHLHLLVEASVGEKGQFNIAKVTTTLINGLTHGNIHDAPVELGAPTAPEKREESKIKAPLVLGAIVSANAGERLKVTVERAPSAPNDGQLDARLFGEELHALLARMHSLTDLHTLEQTRWPWQRMAQHDWQRLLATARTVMEHPIASQWFVAGVKAWAEREVMLESGSTVRPDRVVEVNGHLVVIDFKTGAEDARHHQQVLVYAEALAKSTGALVGGKLFYTDTMKVVDVI